MNVLSTEEVESYIGLNLKNWQIDGESIRRVLKFRNFTEAFSFMTGVALVAEKMDHHPEWTNTYNTVSIRLSTHKPKGITTHDMELAAKIDGIFRQFEKSSE